MVLQIAFRKVSSHLPGVSNISQITNIPWSQSTTFRPSRIAPALQFPEFCVPLLQQYHSSQIGEVLKCNDSKLILHKICLIRGNCQFQRLLVSSSAPRTFVSSQKKKTFGLSDGSRNFRELFSVYQDFFRFTRVRLYPLSG